MLLDNENLGMDKKQRYQVLYEKEKEIIKEQTNIEDQILE